MIHELSSYYLMSYTSNVAPRDGKFHEIQVKVNRKDVDVKARKGYWAYSEEEVRARPASPAVRTAREVSGSARRSRGDCRDRRAGTPSASGSARCAVTTSARV
jgi:hypothetical protein